MPYMQNTRDRMRRRFVMVAAVAAISLGLSACSSDTTDTGNGTSSAPPSPSVSSSPPETETPTSEPIPEVAPGIVAPSNPVAPSDNPPMAREGEIDEAVTFAQGLASALMYNEPVFAPKPNNRPLKAVDLQFINGLSVFALDKYYSWIIDDRAYRQNADQVAGLLFIPPQDAGKRGYAIPAVQNQTYSNVKVAEGPKSSVDGAPTIRASFLLSGDLIWKDDKGIFWIAPITRDISYSVTKQNDSWVLDAWTPSVVKIGKANKATEFEVAGLSFSLVEAEDIPLEEPPGY